MPPNSITCPCCEESFTLSEAAWSVCYGCGQIAPPGATLESNGEYHDGPRGPGTPCFMGCRKYTLEDAIGEVHRIARKLDGRTYREPIS